MIRRLLLPLNVSKRLNLDPGELVIFKIVPERMANIAYSGIPLEILCFIPSSGTKQERHTSSESTFENVDECK